MDQERASMWPLLRKEIERARHALRLTDTNFLPLSAIEWKQVEETVYSQFCKINSTQRPIWLWDSLNTLSPVIKLSLDYWTEPVLTQLLQPMRRVFLYVSEVYKGQEKFWWYEGTVAAIQAVLQEVKGLDEWGVVDKKYNWLLCSTHHDDLVGSGEQIVNAMKQLAASQNLCDRLRVIPASQP